MESLHIYEYNNISSAILVRLIAWLPVPSVPVRTGTSTLWKRCTGTYSALYCTPSVHSTILYTSTALLYDCYRVISLTASKSYRTEYCTRKYWRSSAYCYYEYRCTSTFRYPVQYLLYLYSMHRCTSTGTYRYTSTVRTSTHEYMSTGTVYTRRVL